MEKNPEILPGEGKHQKPLGFNHSLEESIRFRTVGTNPQSRICWLASGMIRVRKLAVRKKQPSPWWVWGWLRCWIIGQTLVHTRHFQSTFGLCTKGPEALCHFMRFSHEVPSLYFWDCDIITVLPSHCSLKTLTYTLLTRFQIHGLLFHKLLL